MTTVGRYTPLLAAVLAGLIFQAMFIAADMKDTPIKAAVEFAQAYYLLDDAAMEKRLCTRAARRVDDYLYQMRMQAEKRGFELKYLKARLSGIHPEVLEMDDKTATIKIVAKKRSSINPLYEFVGKIFFLTEAHDVEKTLTLVKDEEYWRVCGEPFAAI